MQVSVSDRWAVEVVEVERCGWWALVVVEVGASGGEPLGSACGRWVVGRGRVLVGGLTLAALGGQFDRSTVGAVVRVNANGEPFGAVQHLQAPAAVIAVALLGAAYRVGHTDAAPIEAEAGPASGSSVAGVGQLAGGRRGVGHERDRRNGGGHLVGPSSRF